MDGLYGWIDQQCSDTFSFVCKSNVHIVKGSTRRRLEYTLEKLTFSSFHIWYNGNQQVDDDKSRTGFKINWWVENKFPPLEQFVGKVGRSVQTPKLGEITSNDDDYYENDQSHQVNVVFPGDLLDHVGHGRLVIEVEVDTREEDGWLEQVVVSRGGPKTYKLYVEKKSWKEAEDHCQSEIGHLASVSTAGEQRVLDNMYIEYGAWLGGTDQEKEGEWKWSDGSPWTYENWESEKYGNKGEDNNCVKWYRDYGWNDEVCGSTSPFICQSHILTMKGKVSVRLNYTKEELTFSSFHLWYKYKAASHHLLDSWKDKRRTGFTLNWFIQDTNGTVVTKKRPETMDQKKKKNVR